jgi:NitT/TauT family transport system permease protein
MTTLLGSLRVPILITLIGMIFLIFWQLSSVYVIDPFWVSSPSRIAKFLWNFIGSGEIWPHFFATMRAAVIGYTIGALCGMGLGFVLGNHEDASRVCEPYLLAIQGIPKVALAPLFIIWFGIGLESKVVLVLLIVFFLVFFNTFGGARSVSLDLKNAIRLLAATETEILRKVIFPATLPWIFVGLKVSVPNAMIGVIVGEFMAASLGLGYLIQQYTSYFNTTNALGLILVIMFIVVVWTELISLVERRVLRWRPAEVTRQSVEL